MPNAAPPGEGEALVRFIPRNLESLFEAFDILETGVSVCLCADTGSNPPGCADRSSPARLGLYSSGSTGIPELCWHSWPELKSEARITPKNQLWQWASPFSPLSFAGVQVAVQAWMSSARVFSLPRDFQAAAELLASRQVEAISCTPTFFDLLLRFGGSRVSDWIPAQITLGGEVVAPRAGEVFRQRFPNSAFRLVYASAQFGVLLKASNLDGWYETAGLSKRYPLWRVEQGELQIWREDHWQATGDLVQVHGEKLRVIGRTAAVANVGGSKVSLDEIARTAEAFPGVLRARAVAAANPVTGQIVCLRLTLEENCNPGEMRDRLQAYLQQHLRKEAWPRCWEFAEPVLGPNTKEALT